MGGAGAGDSRAAWEVVVACRGDEASNAGPTDAGYLRLAFHHRTRPGVDAERLLYVGIAPRHMRPRVSRQSLRTRIRYHLRGNADGSTLRLTLGCLIGLELRRVGSGARMTFGRAGEAALDAWLAGNARVCW